MTTYNIISFNKNRTYLIFFLFVIFFSGFFYLLGKTYDAGPQYAFMGFAFSLLSSVGSYFYSDKVVLATTGAKPATKEEYFDFYTVTENLAIASGVPMPKLYVMEDPSPNAFATGRDPQHAVVCATTGLLEMMERSELEGVIAHELSHIKNYDILLMTVVAVLVGTLGLVADMIMRASWSRSNDNKSKSPILTILFIVVLVISPIVATLIQLAISRRREFLADASGAMLTRYPEGLARALEKISAYAQPVQRATTSTAHLFISNPFKNGSGPSWISSLFSTHPPAEERVKILRSM